MRKRIFELRPDDYVFGKDRAVFHVCSIIPLQDHDVSVVFESADGEQHTMLADMWHEVEIASVLDWMAQS